MLLLRIAYKMVWLFLFVCLRRLVRGRLRPSWSLRHELLVALCRSESRRMTRLPLPRVRSSLEPPTRVPPRPLATVSIAAGGVPAKWFAPPDTPGSGADESRLANVLLYLHGGGYVFGSTATHGRLIDRLAFAGRMRALAIDYRLAPEHAFPAALEDSLAAYRWLLDQGVAPSHIAVAGDSAGGGLAVATMVAARDQGLPLPGRAALLSPWVDLAASSSSTRDRQPYDIGSRELLLRFAAAYLGGREPRHPLVSPLYANLDKLPPLLILAGGVELLRDEIHGLAERARAAGVEVTLEVWDDMFHVWPAFTPIIPEGQRAIERIGAFLRGVEEKKPAVKVVTG